MKRREFIRTGGMAAGATLFPLNRVPSPGRRRAGLVIRGGEVFDGRDNPSMTADVAIDGDVISAIGPNLDVTGELELDARGHAVAPGFIDPHSHTDNELLINPLAESKVRQGVTTEVCGQDGNSVGLWRGDGSGTRSITGLFDSIRSGGTSVNLGSAIGAGTVRGHVVGAGDRSATATEMETMVALVREARDGGALGISTGLEYIPGVFAPTAELIALAAVFRGTGMAYQSHMRNEDDRVLGAVEEALHIGRLAGVPTHISHLKAQGRRNWWKAEAALQLLESAAADGMAVSFDRYPYVAYSTGLSSLFPPWAREGGNEAFLARLARNDPAIEAAVLAKIERLGDWDAVQITTVRNDELQWAEGRRLGGLALERGVEPYALAVELLQRDSNRTEMVGFGMSEENTERILAHPLGMLCSDGTALAPYGDLGRGTPHPRSYGSNARLLGHYARDRRAMPLRTAIHKMTAMPAHLFGWSNRGVLAVGARADVTIFDPASVNDRATFERPHQYAVGIRDVLVNGVFVVRDAEHTGATPGRILAGA